MSTPLTTHSRHVYSAFRSKCKSFCSHRPPLGWALHCAPGTNITRSPANSKLARSRMDDATQEMGRIDPLFSLKGERSPRSGKSTVAKLREYSMTFERAILFCTMLSPNVAPGASYCPSSHCITQVSKFKKIFF